MLSVRILGLILVSALSVVSNAVVEAGAIKVAPGGRSVSYDVNKISLLLP